MIEIPRRNVTRFFIPMVDIMMLLFSVFLLLPIMQAGSSGDIRDKNPATLSRDELIKQNSVLKAQLYQSEQQLSVTKKRQQDLSKELAAKISGPQVDLQKRLYLQVVKFRPKGATGVWEHATQGPLPKIRELGNATEVTRLIQEHRLEAANLGKDLFYVLVRPAPPQGPTQGELDDFEKMFYGKAPFQSLMIP